MLVRRFPMLILTLCLALPGTSGRAQRALLDREIRELIRHEAPVDLQLNPSVVVGVIDGDSTYVLVYGEPVDTAGLFELGSMTKPVTAWLAERLVDAEGLDPDEIPAFAVIPASARNRAWQGITLHQLLDHRAGLPQWPAGIGAMEMSMDDPYRAYDRKTFDQALAALTPQPGEFRYSHVGYAALYPLFDRAGGFDSVIVRQGGRLGLGFTTGNDQRVLPGHDLAGRPAGVWHTNALEPALGLRASVSDLLRWIRLILPSFQETLSRVTWDRKRFRRETGLFGEYDVHRGWFLVPAGREPACFHTGRTGGHHAAMAMIPAERKAVVVLGTGSSGSGELCLLVLDLIR